MQINELKGPVIGSAVALSTAEKLKLTRQSIVTVKSSLAVSEKEVSIIFHVVKIVSGNPQDNAHAKIIPTADVVHET